MSGSQKLSVFYALSKQKVCRPFFFAEHSVTSVVYICMDEFLISILEEENPDNMVFQLEEAPPHFA
jgi:hypothetical protein